MRFAGFPYRRAETAFLQVCVQEEDRPRTTSRLTLAVILNIKTFGGATLLLVALLIGVTLMHRPPTRPCHRCGRRVKLEHRLCRHCGYEFEPIRFGR
jgi:hypothetical protein